MGAECGSRPCGFDSPSLSPGLAPPRVCCLLTQEEEPACWGPPVSQGAFQGGASLLAFLWPLAANWEHAELPARPWALRGGRPQFLPAPRCAPALPSSCTPVPQGHGREKGPGACVFFHHRPCPPRVCGLTGRGCHTCLHGHLGFKRSSVKVTSVHTAGRVHVSQTVRNLCLLLKVFPPLSFMEVCESTSQLACWSPLSTAACGSKSSGHLLVSPECRG